MKIKQDLFHHCAVHQYNLNEMRRGQLLHAIEKCSPKHLLRTNARLNYFLSLGESEASRGDYER